METRGRKRQHEAGSNDDTVEVIVHEESLDVNLNSVNDETQNPTKRRKMTSDPRILDNKYFVIVKREGENVVVRCTECNELKKGSITSTGNFLKHYRTRHGAMMPKVEEHLKSKRPTNSKPYKNTLQWLDLRK